MQRLSTHTRGNTIEIPPHDLKVSRLPCPPYPLSCPLLDVSQRLQPLHDLFVRDVDSGLGLEPFQIGQFGE